MAIREVSWEEVKDQIKQINPNFFEAMDAAATQQSARLYLASYKFGDLIAKSGTTQLPINNQLFPIDQVDLPEPFKTEFSYAKMIAGIFLNKNAEVFVNFEARVHPLHIFNKGDMYGLWELLDAPNSPYRHQMWDIAAGARTLFLVPKAMDSASHGRMQRLLNINASYPPHNMFQQGNLFKSITDSERIKNDWQCDVLYLGRGWFEAMPKKEWAQFHYTCLQQEWHNSMHLRNHITFEVIWQILTQTQAETRLKPNVYILESVKHLIDIAAGALLGFKPLNHEDTDTAPINIIEKAYLENYKLKHYIPTILAPTYLNRNQGEAVYYSLMLPTLLSLTPGHNFRNVLEDARNVKYLLERFQKRLEERTNSLYHLISNTDFDFFHYEADPLYHIKATATLPELDPRFSSYPQDPKRSFCENGPFVRSCVMIKPKKAQ
jgi:hypothetical protein